MRRWFILSLVVTAATFASAQGATITAPTIDVPEGTNTLSLPLLVSGGESITDMAGFLQLGDGGTVLGGTDTAAVTTVDLSNSVWNSMSSGVTLFFTSTETEPTSPVIDPQINANTAGEYATAEGILFEFTVDITGYRNGDTIPILLSNDSLPPNGVYTQLAVDAVEVPTTLVDGMITITPEPASLSLFGLGGLLALRRHKRRRSAA